MLTRLQILERLQALRNAFVPDQCIDYAYEALEEVENIINDMVGEDEKPSDDPRGLPEYDKELIDSIVGDSRKTGLSKEYDQIQKVIDEFLNCPDYQMHDAEQEFDLPDDAKQGQFLWNNMISEIHTDSIEGEDVYSMCIGYMIAMGYAPDQAHMIASHPNTEL